MRIRRHTTRRAARQGRRELDRKRSNLFAKGRTPEGYDRSFRAFDAVGAAVTFGAVPFTFLSIPLSVWLDPAALGVIAVPFVAVSAVLGWTSTDRQARKQDLPYLVSRAQLGFPIELADDPTEHSTHERVALRLQWLAQLAELSDDDQWRHDDLPLLNSRYETLFGEWYQSLTDQTADELEPVAVRAQALLASTADVVTAAGADPNTEIGRAQASKTPSTVQRSLADAHPDLVALHEAADAAASQLEQLYELDRQLPGGDVFLTGWRSRTAGPTAHDQWEPHPALRQVRELLTLAQQACDDAAVVALMQQDERGTAAAVSAADTLIEQARSRRSSAPTDVADVISMIDRVSNRPALRTPADTADVRSS